MTAEPRIFLGAGLTQRLEPWDCSTGVPGSSPGDGSVCMCECVRACGPPSQLRAVQELPGLAATVAAGSRVPLPGSDGEFFISWAFHFLGAAPRQPSEALPHSAFAAELRHATTQP